FDTMRSPARQQTVAPSDQLGNSATPSSSANPTMQSWPGLTHWPPSSTNVPSPKWPVSVRPPTRLCASNTRTSTPAAASNRAAYKPDRPPPTTTTSQDRCVDIRFLEPLQKVEVVTVRILQADHARAPRLILGRPRQHHAGLAKLGIERVNVGHREADMIDTGRIAEQTKLTAHRRRIGSPHLEEEQLHGSRGHHHAAVVAVRLGEAQPFVKCDWRRWRCSESL